MNLEEVNEGIETNRARKRIGRGVGSKTGKTSGRGRDGHKSRSGYSRHPMFSGSDTPIYMRTPKRGFNNRFATDVVGVNVGAINGAFEEGSEITPADIRHRGLVKVRFDELKILGDGEVTKKLNLVVTRISQSAKAKVEAAGGTVKVVAAKRTPKQRVADSKAKS
ncbi:MAG: 50S ribosomal protein L15 [Planctomycetota bacterium]|jgi:large subunit ribosomal protein L15|nr:50S ribosomal protein L15 [Planctomycetota bacterium]